MNIEKFPTGPTWEEIASSLAHNSTDTERLMVAIYYRFEIEDVVSSDVGVIADEYFRRARWPRPSNLAATANYCASKGWLSEAGQSNGHKLWRITQKGYDAIKARVLQSAEPV